MKCYVRGCKGRAWFKWPLIGVGLCRKHYYKPPRGRWAELVKETEKYLLEQAEGSL